MKPIEVNEMHKEPAPFPRGALLHRKGDPANVFYRYLGWDLYARKVALLRVDSEKTPSTSRVPELHLLSEIRKHFGTRWEVSRDVIAPSAFPDDDNKRSETLKAEWDRRLALMSWLEDCDADRLATDKSYRAKITSQAAAAVTVKEGKTVTVQRIRQLLTAYWWFGSTKLALLPMRAKQGGKGTLRYATNTEKVGARLAIQLLDPSTTTKGVAMTPAFRKPFEDYILKTAEEAYRIRGKLGVAKHMTGVSLYENYCYDVLKERPNRLGLYRKGVDRTKRPKKTQYLYHMGEIFKEKLLAKYFESDIDYKKFSAYAGRVSQSAFEWLNIFEIDGCYVDVGLVWGGDVARHLMNPVGRVLVMFATCRKSGAVIGVDISIENESSNRYRAVLFNAFTDKKDMLKRLGIEHLIAGFPYGPADHIFIDRGAGAQEALAVSLSTDLNIAVELARPRMPVEKPHVEGLNRIFKASISELPGASKSGPSTLDKDAKKHAHKHGAILLEEFMRVVYNFIYDFNTRENVSRKMPCELLEIEGVETTRAGYFNALQKRWGMTQSRQWSRSEIYKRLLETRSVTASKGSFRYERVRYYCDELAQHTERLQSTIGRKKSSIPIKIKILQDTSSFVLWETPDGKYIPAEMDDEDFNHRGDVSWLVHQHISKLDAASDYYHETKSNQTPQLRAEIRERMREIAAQPKKTTQVNKEDKRSHRVIAKDVERRKRAIDEKVLLGIGAHPQFVVDAKKTSKKPTLIAQETSYVSDSRRKYGDG